MQRRQSARWLRIAWTSGLLCLAAPGGHAEPTIEYQIKAALVVNFLHFVAWPEMPDPDPDISICVLDSGRYDDGFEDFTGSAIADRTIALQELDRDSSDPVPESCDVVVLANRSRSEVRRILSSVDSRSVLTIGETTDFGADGGVIRFVTRNDSVQFEVDLAAGSRAKLTISSKMLRLALRVTGGDIGED